MPSAQDADHNSWDEPAPTALLILADGAVLPGRGTGAAGAAVGEICFNTAMTGYQEILTDPSYCGQIVAFTFPHVGNVGANDDDIETANAASSSGVRGVVLRAEVTEASNYRARRRFDDWLTTRGIIGITGLDTRALTIRIRERGVANAVIAHEPSGIFDMDALARQAADWPGLVGMDLAKEAASPQSYSWDERAWTWEDGYRRRDGAALHVVAIDYGVKRTILRRLVEAGCRVTVAPPTATAEEILAMRPDGVFLANGPGDPAATGDYAVPEIRRLIDSGTPMFGICLGHQMIGLAMGGRTVKMAQGHHGANHPVKDFTTGKVEVTSMNHGFAVDRDSLPDGVEETHVSLFDGSNCGLRLKDRPVFSVQHHPEASPGPQDSHYLFKRFIDMMTAK